VIVTGPPGGGKTTIAAAARDGLELPLLAKDTLKETLGGVLGITEREASRQLGVAVFEAIGLLVRELLATRVSLIVEGNFRAGATLFGDLPPARIVQVHVSAPPHVLRERLVARDTHRHPVHYDRAAADEIAARADAGEWTPLQLAGLLIEVDTTAWPNVERLVAEIGDAVFSVT
jgi:predicted kinase